MTQDQIKETLRLHAMWLQGEDDGVRANLHGANLREADLRWADLRGTDLRGTDLRWANLHGANLHGANLHGANLHGADLHGADLRGASLRGASLRGASLRWAVMGGSTGVIRASCSWTDNGESGRELLAVHHPAKDDQPAVTMYYCGCFMGDIEELRQYIADGDERCKASRTIAAAFCEARINEMLAARAGGEAK